MPAGRTNRIWTAQTLAHALGGREKLVTKIFRHPTDELVMTPGA
jgi:hypothetical protein